MPEPHLRAADADRAAVADALGTHMAAGRLTIDEFDDRLARAYAAKTYGELDELTADLPPLRQSRAAVPTPRPETRPSTGGASPDPWAGGWDSSHSWRAWLTTTLIVLTVWGVTSLANWQLVYFWPVWVFGPWGAVLLAQTLTRGRDDDEGRRLPR